MFPLTQCTCSHEVNNETKCYYISVFQCTCGNEICNETKQRFEICRPQVMKAVKSDTIVTCDTAQWICAADATCSKALEYYHAYCQSMFNGKRCSFRCKNSIAILKKQDKAAKLDSCRCSGKEEFDCPRIRTNMARLCFNQTIETPPPVVDIDSNDIKTTYGEKTVDVDTTNNNVSDSANALFLARLSCLWAIVSLIASKCSHRYLLS